LLLLPWLANVPQPDSAILIVYLSRTHNTRAVAKMIHERTGGALVALELVEPYPDDYRTTVDQVARENASGYLPPLANRLDVSRYDTVFIGFPTWGMQLPPPVKSFLHAYDLRGKTVVPFNTNAGYGVGSGFREIRERCPNCEVLEGLSLEGGIERDGVLFVMEGEKAERARTRVEKWLQKIAALGLRN
jgi:flavodoxin